MAVLGIADGKFFTAARMAGDVAAIEFDLALLGASNPRRLEQLRRPLPRFPLYEICRLARKRPSVNRQTVLALHAQILPSRTTRSGCVGFSTEKNVAAYDHRARAFALVSDVFHCPPTAVRIPSPSSEIASTLRLCVIMMIVLLRFILRRIEKTSLDLCGCAPRPARRE